MLQKFVEHTSEFGLSFGTQEEFNFRKEIFEENDKIIEEHNAQKQSFILGHNKFSTYTEYEYKKLLGRKTST
jgi:hypothetical protein